MHRLPITWRQRFCVLASHCAGDLIEFLHQCFGGRQFWGLVSGAFNFASTYQFIHFGNELFNWVPSTFKELGHLDGQRYC